MDGDAPSIELRPAFGEHPPEPSLKVEPHRDVVGDGRGDFEPRLVEGRRHEVEEVRAGVGLVEIGVALAHLGKTDRDAPLLGEAEDAPEKMRVHAGTAQIVQQASDFQVGEPLPGHGELVGEGLEVVGDRVVQLTWKEETAFIWDAGTLELLGSYTYEGEGWGLCAFADRFVMSNGSSRLTFRHLETFGVIGGVDVLLNGEPVDRLNELECVGDLVYANVWLSDHIVVIASDSGRVVARVDASPLRGELSSSDGIDVLNGIAYDPDRRVFYLTGKLWPEIFEVRIGAGP